MKPEKRAEDTPPGRKYLNSRDLFEGQKEVFILHEGQEYRLMITRAGKLILNK